MKLALNRVKQFAIFLLVCLAASLAGCASNSYQGMTAEQISALASMKDANVNCVVLTTPWGTSRTVFVNVDSSVIDSGGVTATPDCAVTFSNAAPAKPGTVTTTTTTVPR